MKLFFQRRIRKFALWLEYITTQWVVPNSTDICLLIENTDKPDFDEYYYRLNELKIRWKIHDSEIESYFVRGRLMEFKIKNKLK